MTGSSLPASGDMDKLITSLTGQLLRRVALPVVTALANATDLRRLAEQWRRADRAIAASIPHKVEAALATGLLALCALLATSGVVAAAAIKPRTAPVTAAVAGTVIERDVVSEAVSPLPTDPPPKARTRKKAATTTVPTTTPPPPPPPAPPTAKGALPVGKGMWLYVPEQIEGGNVDALVARAQAVGITHVYVRTGSSRMGFYAQDYMNRLLPKAHAGGLRVYGWDFPYFDNWQDDVNRAVAAITYTTPDGHRLDGFSADIETRSQGVKITPESARAYGTGLRRAVGTNYPLIATVPRPSPKLVTYPFAEVVEHFDAIAPMIYWLNRHAGPDAAEALTVLKAFNKPLMPVGQAYNGGPEGGRPEVPRREELLEFMRVSDQFGATSVSFWSWQHADQQAWDAVRDAPEFRLAPMPGDLPAGYVRSYQHLLTSLGFPSPIDGVWGQATVDAVSAYQRAARLPVTGHVDQPTLAILLTPFAPPVQPLP